MKTSELKVKQGVSDLPACKQDIEDVIQAFAYYDIYCKPEHRLDEPTKKDVGEATKCIKKAMKASPEKKFFIVWALAGHGIQKEGKQAVVVNTFDEK